MSEKKSWGKSIQEMDGEEYKSFRIFEKPEDAYYEWERFGKHESLEDSWNEGTPMVESEGEGYMLIVQIGFVRSVLQNNGNWVKIYSSED